ncbi:MAG: hypothetical protein ACJ78I_11910 [Gemmatimonadaceae bacterium]
MTSLETQKDTRERVVALIASHAGVTAESVQHDSPIWDHFPTSTNRWAHPTVTSFVQDVHSEFNVYLTEEEWEDPTPNTLTEDIHAKRENSATSVADLTHDRAAVKKGMISLFVIIAIFFPAILFFGSGPWLTRLAVGLGMPLFLGLMLLLGYRKETRKMDASAPRQ